MRDDSNGDDFSLTDLEETDVPDFKAPRLGRAKKEAKRVGFLPPHLRPVMRSTIYVPKDAPLGPHKVDVPKRKSDTVMF